MWGTRETIGKMKGNEIGEIREIDRKVGEIERVLGWGEKVFLQIFSSPFNLVTGVGKFKSFSKEMEC